MSYQEVKEAKAILEKNGYQVYNLWHIDDVRHKYDCTEEEAQGVLINALQNDATMTQIWLAIDFHAEDEGLKLKTPK